MFISLVSVAFVSILPSLDSEMPTAGNHRRYTIIGQVFPPFQDNFCRPNDVRVTSLVPRDTSAVADSRFHSPTIGGAKYPDWQRECCRSNCATNLRSASRKGLAMFCEDVGLHYFTGIHFGVSILERSCIPMDLACRLVCSVTHDTDESFLILAGSDELVPREGSSRRPRIEV